MTDELRCIAPMDVIDVHVHCDLSSQRGLATPEFDSAEQFRLRLLATGVRWGMTDSHHPMILPGCNAGLPLSHYVVVGPEDIHSAQIVEQIASGLFCGVKVNLGFLHTWPSDTRLTPIYEAAVRARLPILLHSGDPSWSRAKIKYAHPLAIDEVAVDHPDAIFLIAQCGSPWFVDAVAVASKNDNVLLETSSIVDRKTCLQADDRLTRMVTEPLRWACCYLDNPAKFVFGSGWPLVDALTYRAAVAAAFPPSWHEQVFRRNAVDHFALAPDGPSPSCGRRDR